MDFEADLGGSVGPYRELFADVQDIIHPLKFSSGIQFAFSTPLNAAFGIIHTYDRPSGTPPRPTPAPRLLGPRRPTFLVEIIAIFICNPTPQPQVPELVRGQRSTREPGRLLGLDLRAPDLRARRVPDPQVRGPGTSRGGRVARLGHARGPDEDASLLSHSRRRSGSLASWSRRRRPRTACPWPRRTSGRRPSRRAERSSWRATTWWTWA